MRINSRLHRKCHEVNQLDIQQEFLGGSHRHKIDYSAVAEESRCARRNLRICMTLNELYWSGRSDSN